ncbi:hypothetical protein EJ02DRAFT_209698 [Clathrospora elynae]|uniref:Uncharacterized protein n=1 Tax=Clathrospora elynae TaxID=706981 RepID=A0A6A5SR61_9PLEO|nr:hypothetical protein EJ02DRAFT_209698 [Clathrospora elynae]
MRCCHSLLNMAIGPFVILLLLRLTQAQFIQHYNYENGVPNWRRQIAPHIINQPVIVPDFPIYLEYNCWKMPAICQNVRNWLNDPKLSKWPTRPGPNMFTYDMFAATKKAYSQGTSSKPGTLKRNSDHR